MLLGGVALAIALALPGQPAGAQTWTSERWTGTWGTAPAGPPPAANLQTFTDQTLRLIVHTSIGGNRVRIRVSNEFGATPLRIGAARIGAARRAVPTSRPAPTAPSPSAATRRSRSRPARRCCPTRSN